MEVLRKKGLFQIAVDNEMEAIALYAVVYNHPEWTTPEQFAKAQTYWAHFCAGVQELALNYSREMEKRKVG